MFIAGSYVNLSSLPEGNIPTHKNNYDIKNAPRVGFKDIISFRVVTEDGTIEIYEN